MNPSDRDSNVTSNTTQGEVSETNPAQETTQPAIVPPNLDEIDLDDLKAEEMESIDELMVRYDIDIEPESEPKPDLEPDLELEHEPEDEPDEEQIAVTEQQAEMAAQLYLTGRRAFESGYYRQAIANLERSAALSVGASPIGGEIKIWLVLAYHAYGNLEAALALCRKLTHHPHIPTRKQGRRLRAILEAPELVKRPEWFSEIPDLSDIEDSEGEAKKGASGTYKPRPIRPLKEPEIDPATINRRDNQFIWVAIVLTIAILAYLAYIARFG